jgi:hypothetical protein
MDGRLRWRLRRESHLGLAPTLDELLALGELLAGVISPLARRSWRMLSAAEDLGSAGRLKDLTAPSNRKMRAPQKTIIDSPMKSQPTHPAPP